MIKPSLTIFIILFSTVSYAQSETPVEYMSKMFEFFDPIKKEQWDYVRKSSRGKSAGKVEKQRIELVNTIKKARYDLGRMPAYKGDASLKQALSNYLQLSYHSLNDDYKRIVDLEKIAEESYDDMEAYIMTKEQVSSKMDSAFLMLENAQFDFAHEYNINLVEGEGDKLSKKLENAGEVRGYYNKVYLLYFKSSFYESEMIKAVSAGSVGDAEQFRQALETTAKEGKAELVKIGDFRGDNSLKYACSKMFDFFNREAVKYMPFQIDFLSKTDQMDTMRKNFDAKKQKDLTQKDVDAYNKAVNDYNKSISKFNETNEMLNKNRTNNYRDFDKTVQKFFDKFM